ncbi:unnamed protein product [Mycena citricolor]|uniref:Uncharacterized protein n=1 Tax=Mycena citricolor TaxID=2018698 RepID=A0AAD2HB95_9AGAR|nr:unnamed protein product [Mycena citricolor]CAK5272596.1 unnamed protein product [Mycena citricolor]
MADDAAWLGTLQINVVSTALLGLLLLPLLHKTGKLGLPHPDAPDFPPHLTFLGSADPFYVAFRADNAPRILDALNESSTHIDRYGMTKLVLLMLARQMGQLPIAHKVVINCANPGIVRTQKSRLCVSCTNLLAWSPEDGATNLVYAVLKPTPPGAYLAACQIRDPPMWVSSLDGQQAQQRVWWELLDVWMRITPEALGVVGFGLKGVQS